MNEYEVIADVRTERGSGPNRRLRRSGAIPGVLYGGDKEPVPLALEGNRLRKQIENEAFFSHVLTLKVSGEETQAIVKELQRDPATSFVIHLDFQRVSATEEIHMNVPLHFVGEDASPGKKAGGVVTHLLVEVEIGCLPKDLPEYIEVDMSAIDVGDSLHLSELTLPAGVRLMTLAHNPDNDQPIVSVQHPQKLEEEEEAAEGVEGLEEGEVAAAPDADGDTTADEDDG